MNWYKIASSKMITLNFNGNNKVTIRLYINPTHDEWLDVIMKDPKEYARCVITKDNTVYAWGGELAEHWDIIEYLRITDSFKLATYAYIDKSGNILMQYINFFGNSGDLVPDPAFDTNENKEEIYNLLPFLKQDMQGVKATSPVSA